MANARVRTADLGAANAQSPWCSAKKGLNVTISGTFSGTVSLLRRAADGNVYPYTVSGTAVTFTAAASQAYIPGVEGDFALKMTAYTSGTANVVLEGV